MDEASYARMAALEDRHFWWRARREIVARVLAARLPPAPRPRQVLEVGCGSGGNLPMLARFGVVRGIDASASAVRHYRLREHARHEVTQHALPAPLEDTFDLIAMLDVLEHIDDDVGALAWVARQLAVGGHAILTVPAFGALWSELDEHLHHRRRYTMRALLRRLPASLTPVHASYFNTLLFAPIALARLGLRLFPRALVPDGLQLTLPGARLNELLTRIFLLEQHVVPRARIPLGVSLLVLVRRTS